MVATDDHEYGFELERAELEMVLQSSLFGRSLVLVQVLDYICRKHFAGEAQSIKEYNIAVEALGRPADFQQKADPIVRVEAGRLRRRLEQYYQADGKNHPVQISIPQGQYAPVFHLEGTREDAARFYRLRSADLSRSPGDSPGDTTSPGDSRSISAAEAGAEVSSLHSAAVPSSGQAPGTRGRRYSLNRLAAVIASLIVLVVLVYAGRSLTISRPPERDVVAPAAKDDGIDKTLPAMPTPEGGIRIMAGSDAERYVDRMGNVWVGDRYFKGGLARSFFDIPISFTEDHTIYNYNREGDFGYEIPLQPGIYELRLHFSENLYGPDTPEKGGEASRLINVTANGSKLLEDFDVLADAGGSRTANIKVFKDIVPENGMLRLAFSGSKGQGMVSGIEVVPGIPGRMHPIRIITRSSTYSSPTHRVLWFPDRYFRGGRNVARTRLVLRTDDPALYQNQRYGHFTYMIPVAQGTYTVRLTFAETYFGSVENPSGGVESRLFDVLCNGRELLSNFDIYKEAGGEYRPLDKVFRGIKPNAQGKIIVSFVPIRNYACVSSIEVIDETTP